MSYNEILKVYKEVHKMYETMPEEKYSKIKEEYFEKFPQIRELEEKSPGFLKRQLEARAREMILHKYYASPEFAKEFSAH